MGTWFKMRSKLLHLHWRRKQVLRLEKQNKKEFRSQLNFRRLVRSQAMEDDHRATRTTRNDHHDGGPRITLSWGVIGFGWKSNNIDTIKILWMAGFNKSRTCISQRGHCGHCWGNGNDESYAWQLGLIDLAQICMTHEEKNTTVVQFFTWLITRNYFTYIITCFG